MKLRGIHLFLIIAPIAALLGYVAEPIVLDALVGNKSTAKKTTAHPKHTTAKTDTSKKGPEVGEKQAVDLDDLLGDGTPSDDKEPEPIVVTDDGEIDPSSFTDSAEEESEEESERRLSSVRKRPASDSKVVVAVEEPYTTDMSASFWRNCKNLKRTLASRIRSRVKGVEPEQLEAFIKVPENRLMLAQWQLLHMCDEKLLSKALSDTKTAQSLAPLLNDLQWITGFVYDGEVKHPDVALAILAHLRAADPNMDLVNLSEEKGEVLRDPTIKRRIAGAVAAEFANNGYCSGEQKALTAKELAEMKEMGMPIPKSSGRSGKVDTYKLARERYLFFAEGVNERLFNPYFYSMPNWLMRFTCGWKANTAFGSANTMRWHRDNNSAPHQSYLGMCSDVPYLPTNIFGDSIHGPQYYTPFDVLYPDNFAKQTRDVGAVCGGLSHYGTSAACSNGIPAFTMGEPGHCAYAVYYNDAWVPCNSIFPEKFPHWSFWGESTWSALTLYTNMYQDGQRTRDAQLIATLAALLAEYSNPNNALKAYEISIAMQPINRATWNDYIKTAINTLRKNPRRWLTVNKFLCSSMAPTNPSACALFLQESIYPTMLQVLRSERQKLEAYEQFFASLKTQEENVWKIDALLDMQHAPIGKSRSSQLGHFELVAKAVCEKPEFGLGLTWAIRSAYTDDKNTGAQLMKEVMKYRETSPNKELVDAAIIRAAEELGDEELFTQYSAPYLDGIGGMPELPSGLGNLISKGGCISLSSYGDDLSKIVHHAAALTEKGGCIESEGGKHQKLTVILPKAQRIGAIIIVPTAGSCSSYYEWELEISKDGKTWETIAALPDRSSKASVNLIINKSHPTAKYIRIDSGSDQTLGIKFKAVLVYDNKKLK